MSHSEPRNDARIVDLSQLEDTTEGDADLERELVALFYAGMAGRFPALDRSLQEEAWETLARDAHSLKGSSANMGAVRMSETARRLQEAAMRRERQGCRRLLDVLRRDFEDVRAIFDERLG